MSQLIIFKIVLGIIGALLFVFQIALWKRLLPWTRHLKWIKFYRYLYFSILFFSQALIWIGVLYPGRGSSHAYPEWYIPIHKILLAINYTHLFLVLPFLFLWFVGAIAKRFIKYRQKKNAVLEKNNTAENENLSRGDFLRKAGVTLYTGANLLPAVSSAAAISGMFLGSKEIWVNEKNITIQNLHNDLKGVRIAQISDSHIGNLIHEKYLNAAVDLIRAAKLDYIFLTGDIIDNNNLFLPVAGKFIAALRKLVPWGHVVGVMGNHDYIDNGDKAAQSFGDAGMNVLRNEIALFTRGKGKLQVVGLDYPPIRTSSRLTASKQYFDTVKKKLKEENPTFVLNHHPSDFEYLKNEKIDFVFSGHTHGGQVRLSHNRESFLNSGSWFYKYYVDLYNENGVQLYVNRGLGHWFPLRIDCPPEITVFTLV
ncbi:MAG TPA: metallophosphoesterase [Turneriella sp.]|nr:metallophosphoesterase [Turneriella sp.]